METSDRRSKKLKISYNVVPSQLPGFGFDFIRVIGHAVIDHIGFLRALISAQRYAGRFICNGKFSLWEDLSQKESKCHV